MASPNSDINLDNIAPYQLEEYLSRLEDERLKIDAFKHELPLSMDLLSSVVEASRQQLQSYKATTITNQGTTKRPILEEFIPIKHLNLEAPPDQQKPQAAISDKASWMASARLWSPADEEPTAKRSEPLSTKLPPLDNNNKSGGVPLGDSAREIKLTFTSAKTKMNGAYAASTATSSTSRTSQTNRKRRRLWSPDLHRRFLDALQILGGSRVTARQIQELMKVDGLTYDEVKSHLQKYKLDTRRSGPSPQGPSATGPQSVVLGGMWVPLEYASAAHRLEVQGPTSIYGPQPTAQMGPRYYPHEFYSPPPPLWHGSLKSHGGRPERDRSGSFEDGKCESSSDRESNGRKKVASQALVS